MFTLVRLLILLWLGLLAIRFAERVIQSLSSMFWWMSP